MASRRSNTTEAAYITASRVRPLLPFITDINASPVAGQKAEKCPCLKWLQVTMRVENTSTQKPAARQENN
ncbi:TPA_asm: hypothetical protein G1Q02_05395 [Salmonella enterica subsp. enterica serovar Typhimurium]|nr:hypothetical protein [Salmonella enterica subsp. enterica serovar Typhimurium]